MNATNFQRVAAVNEKFKNPQGDPKSIDFDRVRSQSRSILHEFCELQLALGANPEAIKGILDAAKAIQYPNEVHLDNVRDGACDIHIFGYGIHHMMGIDADRDVESVLEGLMTRFIKDEADKQASIAKHAAAGVTQVYFEGDFPLMIMKSAVDQPDAPKGKFLKSASYTEPVFYRID